MSNKFRISKKHVPLIATLGVWLLLYATASIRFSDQYFFTSTTLANLLRGNAHLGIIAIGMTFVILSGGIDLSVGAVMALTTMFLAVLLQDGGHGLAWGMDPVWAIALVLMSGTLFGMAMGSIIRFFNQPAFLVTLAGMFLARGLAQVISLQPIRIDHPWHKAVRKWNWETPGDRQEPLLGFFDAAPIPASVLVMIGMFGVAIFIAHWTRFGRNVYAIGGSESSSVLMGLPVGRTKILVYAISGFCSALAGVVFTFNVASGNSQHGVMLELDAIAAVVIGGTLLTGGVGYMLGTFIGVLIFGIIQTAIRYEPGIDAYWTRIIIGLLLLAFIVLQRFLQRRRT
jgi:ribose/xylose/arabinose/galactoside ABC-type transport system permease subunit